MDAHDQPHVRVALAGRLRQLHSRCERCEDRNICTFRVSISDYSAHSLDSASVHEHGAVVEVMISKNLLQCHSVHRESHIIHPGFNPSLASRKVRVCRSQLREALRINWNITLIHIVHNLIFRRQRKTPINSHISMAFNTEWHEGLTQQLFLLYIPENIIHFVASYRKRKQAADSTN
jgi:hypothetical protein